MQVAVLSDTHSPRFWKGCPPSVAEQLVGVDLILHAGDVCTADVLDQLSAYAPVRVVMGNNDRPEVAEWGATETLELELDGLSVAMIHDSGPATGRSGRMRLRFPRADLVVFGHSHIPMDLTDDGMRRPGEPDHRPLRVFNPGSPTDRRRQPSGTVGRLTIDGGVLVEARIVPVER